MSDDIPVGLPFSQAYLRPEKPLQDDKRFRRRLSALFDIICPYNSGSRGEIRSWLKLRGGIEVPAANGVLWDQFFQEGKLVDVLDAIGLIFKFFAKGPYGGVANRWKAGVTEIFQEQAMAYRLDDGGAVRHLIDKEFDRARAAAIAGLGKPRYKIAREFFDAAVEALEQSDTAGMVKNTFLAVEEVFKLMYGVDRLTAGTVGSHLKPDALVSTQSAITASREMASSFAKWVIACQQYRHAPGEIHDGHESPAAPPLDLAIVMTSAGAAYLRWRVTPNPERQFHHATISNGCIFHFDFDLKRVRCDLSPGDALRHLCKVTNRNRLMTICATDIARARA